MTTADDMLVFRAVAAEGSFSAAARALGVRKQSVAQRINQLEQALGVQLVTRHRRGLELTEAGHLYHGYCDTVAIAVRQATAEVTGLRQDVSGRLRVSLPVQLGRRHLARVLADLAHEHPALTVEVLLNDRRVDLIADAIDVAVRVGPSTDPDLVARKVGVGLVHLVASPEWCADREPLQAQDLAADVCIVRAYDETWRVAGQDVRVGARVVISDLEAACSAAVAGLGVARLPSFVHQDHVDAGRLVRLFGGEVALRRSIYLVFPSRRYLPAKVRVFVDAMARELGRAFPLDAA